MKKQVAPILQVLLVLSGILVLVLLIRLPLTEGRAANLDLAGIYSDPLIIYGYIASVPFFIGVYKLFCLLGFFRQGTVVSPRAIQSLKQLRLAALVFAGLIFLAAIYIRFNHHEDDDPAGFIALCAIAIAGALLTVLLANRFQKKLQEKL